MASDALFWHTGVYTDRELTHIKSINQSIFLIKMLYKDHTIYLRCPSYTLTAMRMNVGETFCNFPTAVSAELLPNNSSKSKFYNGLSL